MPEELTPTALAKILSWALVHEPSQDSRDAIHNGRELLYCTVLCYVVVIEGE